MYIKRLFFPGEFDEAYIYMQKLLLFDAEGNLFFVNLDHIASYLEAYSSSDVKSLPTHLFSRNDWMTGERFTSILKNSLIRKAFLKSLTLFPDQIEIPTKDFIHRFAKTKINDLLDVAIYNRRVYMGTDNGTFHLDLDWKKREVVFKKLKKRHEAMCTQVNVRYGSVSISCGEDGLFTRFDDFGWLDYDSYPEWEEVSQKSLRTSWLFEDLLNYIAPAEPVLLRVNQAEEQFLYGEMRKKEKVAIGFEGEPIKLDYLLHSITPTNKQSIDMQFIFLHNTLNTFLVQTQERKVLEIPIKHIGYDDNLIAAKPKYLWEQPISRILDIKTIHQKQIFELYDSVHLLSDNELHKLAMGEALSIKTYPSSRHFQNLVTIVVETGVYIISLFDVHGKI